MTRSSPSLDEVQRLMRRCRQHEDALERLAGAVTVLRRGNEALRAENRELRVALEQARSTRRTRDLEAA